MIKKQFSIILIGIFFTAPSAAFALQLPTASELVGMLPIDAQAYAVADPQTGEIILSKNSDTPWPPASLTKLITAMVVLDSKVKLNKTVAITSADQTAGACSMGGACIKAKIGVKFSVDGLFHAALMPSANNAAYALSRSTGLTADQFVERMNKKALSLGALNTHFNEPTGMDPTNRTTAGDYVKIVAAAFKNPYLGKIAGLQNFVLRSSNNSRYNQTIKNTDKLLADADVQMLGAKTGFLNESLYNFASLLKFRNGQQYAVVVLGEQHLYTAFAETKLLANLAQEARALAALNAMVLGTTTPLSINN